MDPCFPHSHMLCGMSVWWLNQSNSKDQQSHETARIWALDSMGQNHHSSFDFISDLTLFFPYLHRVSQMWPKYPHCNQSRILDSNVDLISMCGSSRRKALKWITVFYEVENETGYSLDVTAVGKWCLKWTVVLKLKDWLPLLLCLDIKWSWVYL